MTRCDVQASGHIELYFYDELDPMERASIERHVRGCAECAHALAELRIIRDALAARPDVCAPESGDWSPFMARLDTAIQAGRDSRAAAPSTPRRASHVYVAYLAMAALIALVTVSVAIAWRARHVQPAQGLAADANSGNAVRLPSTGLGPGRLDATGNTTDKNADFEALSDEHFERSKLVVLGLATKDAAGERPSDWAYERELASSLLNDTRMYRLAAEDRGLTGIAGVMRDLELVLLQTSMTDERDPAALQQIQRVIQKRDLLEKMDSVTKGL
jgi:hypothetical protein